MRRIGRYRILSRLGTGGMGAVYKAAMPVTGKVVALKLLRPGEMLEEMMGRERLAEMFEREARTMARIRHPNVAQVWDVDFDGGRPFFIMEYYCRNLGAVMGEDYEVERRSRVLGPEAAADYARQILSGLARLHHAGIVHRDVKPFNAMIADEGERGTIKLIDFGLSVVRGERAHAAKGMMVGSPYYTAPEQEADPERADARSDVFSVAVTLFRMLTGRLPEPDQDAGPGRFNPVAADAFDELVVRGLRADPARRFQSAAEMIDALDRALAAWLAGRDAACALYEPPERPCLPVRGLRADPLKASRDAARNAFGLDGLMHPARCVDNDFEERGETVLDRATGLVWMREAAPYALTLAEARAYVGGLGPGWRLPTVDELATLVADPDEPGGGCQAGPFPPRPARLWSADRKSGQSGWYADLEFGFIEPADDTCSLFVRAVRTARPGEEA